MTAKERQIARDLVARARLAKDGPESKARPPKAKRENKRGWSEERLAAGDAALNALRNAGKPKRYPVPGRTSIVECPVHQLVVALDENGRLASTCPECRREADDAIELLEAVAA